MAIETIVSNLVGTHLGTWVRKWYERRQLAQIKAMPYAEKRKYVEESQRGYLAPKLTLRYRIGFRIARLLRRV